MGRLTLADQGIRNVKEVYWNLSTPALYEEAVRRHEGVVAHLGPLVVRTGQHNGEDGLFDLAGIGGAANQDQFFAQVQEDKDTRVGAIYLRDSLEAGAVDDGKIGNKILQFFLGGLNKHVAGEEALPGGLGDGSADAVSRQKRDGIGLHV